MSSCWGRGCESTEKLAVRPTSWSVLASAAPHMWADGTCYTQSTSMLPSQTSKYTTVARCEAVTRPRRHNDLCSPHVCRAQILLEQDWGLLAVYQNGTTMKEVMEPEIGQRASIPSDGTCVWTVHLRSSTGMQKEASRYFAIDTTEHTAWQCMTPPLHVGFMQGRGVVTSSFRRDSSIQVQAPRQTRTGVHP